MSVCFAGNPSITKEIGIIATFVTGVLAKAVGGAQRILYDNVPTVGLCVAKRARIYQNGLNVRIVSLKLLQPTMVRASPNYSQETHVKNVKQSFAEIAKPTVCKIRFVGGAGLCKKEIHNRKTVKKCQHQNMVYCSYSKKH